MVMQDSLSAMHFARLFGIFLLIHMCICSENRQREPSDYEVGNDEHNASALGSLGKYFIYVNCTTCKVKNELQVEAKRSNEEEEHVSKENTKTNRMHTHFPVSPGSEKRRHVSKENTKTNRMHTHFPVSPGSEKRRIEGKTTPYGVTKEAGEAGQGKGSFPSTSRGGGTREMRKTTPYVEERKEEEEEEEKEEEKVEEAREAAARLERMKINETTASPIYHLPGDTPYPPWFTFMTGKIVKKTGTGSTELTAIQITILGRRGTEVTGTERMGTEIRSTGEMSTEVIGTGRAGTEATDTEATDTEETGTEEIGTGKTSTVETSTEETSTEVIDTGRTGSEETDTEESVTGETGSENKSTAETTTKKKKKKS